MIIGEFSPAIFFKICSYVISVTLPLIYFQSQWYGHEPPFPKCWISDCAAHYPEYVFFRIATISGSMLIMLGWLTNHFYLKSISREHAFRIDRYLPQLPLVMGMMGAMLLMGSTANIDTGKRHPSWHTFCASHFFIFTVLAILYNTALYCIVRIKIGTVSLPNLYFKLALVAALFIQAYISINFGASLDQQAGDVKTEIGVILEWTLTLTVIANFYSMALDVENFKFVYEMGAAEMIGQMALLLISMFIGEFSPALFFKLSSYTISVTLPIIYWISQYYGHEPPFPNCWISGCAGHFPEYVFFRIATISGSVLVILGWLTNHFYLKSICREAVFKIDSLHPEIAMVMGMMGGMLLMGSTANIDTGKHNSKWHTFCASRFFIFTLAALLYNTVVYSIVHSKVGKVNVANLYFKLVLLAALFVQLIISIEYGEFDAETWERLGSINVILEWTLTLTVIANFYSMGVDVENFKFVYEINPTSSQDIQEVD